MVLTGLIGEFFAFCVSLTAIAIIVIGTWVIINAFIWDVLIVRALKWTIYYKRLFYYLWYYRDIKEIIGNKADNLFKEEEKPPTK